MCKIHSYKTSFFLLVKPLADRGAGSSWASGWALLNHPTGVLDVFQAIYINHRNTTGKPPLTHPRCTNFPFRFLQPKYQRNTEKSPKYNFPSPKYTLSNLVQPNDIVRSKVALTPLQWPIASSGCIRPTKIRPPYFPAPSIGS